MRALKKIVPKKLKRLVKELSKPIPDIPKDKYCPVCQTQTSIRSFPYKAYFEKFYEHGFVYSPFLFETLNLKHYNCNNCGATDRDRLMALYISKEFKSSQGSTKKLVDFAPVKALSGFLKGLENVNYRSADLYMTKADDKVDITNMTVYSDQSFDFFICSHVLEHIEEDSKAMSELFRITKKGGIGLCLVPILLSIDKTVENKEYLESEHLRWKYFGQDDHVRMYSKMDFVKRLKTAGFEVEQVGVSFFGEENFEKSGLDFKSVLYVVKRLV